MSHSAGLVRFKNDGLVKWYEYNGTGDVCMPKLYDPNKQMHDNWRSDDESIWMV